MDRVKRARIPVRASFTRTLNELKAELDGQNPVRATIEAKFKKLEATWEELQTVDDRVKEAMLDADCSEADILEERDSVDKYGDEWFTIAVKVRNSQPKSRSGSPTPSFGTATTSGSNKKRTFKLPKIELKKFNGDLTEWLGWWAQFSKIHEDDDLHDTDKFQYLVQSMTAGSRAKDLVESYPQSASNYPKAISALKERFGKEKLLKQVYVRELLKMVMNNARSKEKLQLAKMFDKLESHLRALESLGVTADQTAEFLFPMVESSLPEDVLVAWQRSSGYGQDGSKANPPKTELDYLMDFLRQEVESEGQRTLARSGFESTSRDKREMKSVRAIRNGEDLPTAAGLFSGHNQSCAFCGKSHSSQDCFKAQTMSLAEKIKLKENRSCFSCLRPGHMAKACKSPSKCIVCQGRHPTLLCNDIPANKIVPEKKTAEEKTISMSNQLGLPTVPLQTLMVRILSSDGRKKHIARLVYDSGSQGTSILSMTVRDLKLKSSGEVSVRRALYGGAVTDLKNHRQYKLQLESMDGKFRRDLIALDEQKICGDVACVPRGPWIEELAKKKILLTDLDSSGSEIEILVGNDYYGQLLTGRVEHLDCGLTAIETVLGWTLSGIVPSSWNSNAMIVTSMWASEAIPSELWNLETLGILDPVEHKTRQEKEVLAKEHFMETVCQGSDGRYSVSLPWINQEQKIPDNRIIAEKRLETMTMKLVSTGKFEAYEEVFRGWESEGIIEEVPKLEIGSPCHYIPHRAVFKPESLTTPLRPVFDASCKSKREPSLNDCLEKGPNLLELIPNILLRFRRGKIGIISDVRKAFLQIEIKREDRDFLRFFWWQDWKMGAKKVFRHRRVVFGVNCSPFLLGAVIEHHLAKYNGIQEDGVGMNAEKLLQSLYVDNCVTSVDTCEELESFRAQSTSMMAEAKMELRQWEWTSQNLESNVFSTVLGMKWNKREDFLLIETMDLVPEVVTKRSVLSCVHKIFDPMGFLCPAMLSPKLLLQESWAEKTGWDEEFSKDQKEKFRLWSEELNDLQEIRIPRNMTGQCSDLTRWQLHMFCDASSHAYAAVVFLRTEVEGVVSIQLMQAKARVAPLKNASIPRLELLSCTIGARLVTSVVEALGVSIPTYFWSDSTTALAWIKRNDEWGTFVGNRVREICKLTNANSWRHVPGVLNPADLPSRGCTPSQLKDARWFEGPVWLKSPMSDWPSGEVSTDDEEVLLERKKTAISNMTVQEIGNFVPWYVRRFSSYLKNVRVVAWITRFLKKTRKKSQEAGELSVAEVEEAELIIFKMVQNESFSIKERSINGILVVLDDQGLIRVKTKILHRDDSKEFRCPVLLPSDHPLTTQLIRWEHNGNKHAGIQFLMGKLREKYWILQGRTAIKKVIRTCVRCRRFAGKSPVTVPAPLPLERVNDARVFETVGVDLAGPLFLRDNSKVWIVLSTCAVFRCVHLEIASSLSTEVFLWAFQRFIDRRGRPTTVFSDNGTNFVGAANLFKDLDWVKIEREMHIKRIQWKFNPPSAAWWGGWWERLIRIMKDLLKRSLGNARLTYEELSTTLCHVESIMNGRPLTYITEDAGDLVPLTPKMFLQDIQESEAPEVDCVSAQGLQRRYRYKKKLKAELRSRFRKEYLSQLVQRGKEMKNQSLAVGDVVLVGSDNKKRLEWPMAKIIELLPGKDGVSRVARVKTSTGTYLRPLQRLYPLEVSSSVQVSDFSERVLPKSAKQTEKEKTPVVTRSGRKVQDPVRYGFE